MKTIYDLKELMTYVENHYNTLMSIYRAEVKEDGSAHEDTIIRFNALAIQIQRACENLSKGLDGEI